MLQLIVSLLSAGILWLVFTIWGPIGLYIFVAGLFVFHALYRWRYGHWMDQR